MQQRKSPRTITFARGDSLHPYLLPALPAAYFPLATRQSDEESISATATGISHQAGDVAVRQQRGDRQGDDDPDRHRPVVADDEVVPELEEVR